MSFNRADYERLVEIARALYALDQSEEIDNYARELFQLAGKVIGQISPPLEEQEFSI